MTGDKLIRFVTAFAVLAVAVIAAIVSYSHIEYLALVNGQTITAARLLPASVDGVVLVSSVVMLDAARRDADAPVLARLMLVAGVLATLAANSAVGASHGVVGILVSGWPAVAFIGCAETFLAMIRGRSSALSSTAETVPDTVPYGVPEIALAGEYPAAPRVPVGVPASATEATQATARQAGSGTASGTRRSLSGSRRPTPVPITPEATFSAEIEAGTLPSIRVIKRRMSCGQDKAKVIRSHLATLMSGVPETIEVMS